jgi:hypothetical protein
MRIPEIQSLVSQRLLKKMSLVHKPLHIATATCTLLGVISTACPAHEWHRPHDASGTPIESPGFSIPEEAGSDPDNAADVAERAGAFAPFFPEVRVRWDGTWLYVESNGMPSHGMMAGITNWQQQVGIPQNYYADNAWQIPLKPELSDNPISTRDNLFRGAIALAVNGVPIFNALNNRGEDAFLIGELDDWGGHAGRADDYHYHAAPLHLQDIVGEDAPIAYALDGYPIYGLKEPDGSEVVGLDEYNGHFGPGYHYHASLIYPYINGGLRGVITVEGGQVEPQPGTWGVRPATTPLRDAEIISYETQGESGHSILYTYNNQSYTFSWSTDETAETATFSLINPGGSVTSNTYSGWVVPPEFAGHSLEVISSGSGLLSFSISGEPGMTYPFASSIDLGAWQRLGFLQLGDDGKQSFDLNTSDTTGFIRITGKLTD